MSKTETRMGLKHIPTVLSESNAGPVQGMQVSSDAIPFGHSSTHFVQFVFFVLREFSLKNNNNNIILPFSVAHSTVIPKSLCHLEPNSLFMLI